MCVEMLISILSRYNHVKIRGPISGRVIHVYAVMHYLIEIDTWAKKRENKVVMIYDRIKQKIIYVSRALQRIIGGENDEQVICDVVKKLRSYGRQ